MFLLIIYTEELIQLIFFFFPFFSLIFSLLKLKMVQRDSKLHMLLFETIMNFYIGLEPTKRVWKFIGNLYLRILALFTDNSKTFYSNLAPEQISDMKALYKANLAYMKTVEKQKVKDNEIYNSRIMDNPLMNSGIFAKK